MSLRMNVGKLRDCLAIPTKETVKAAVGCQEDEVKRCWRHRDRSLTPQTPLIFAVSDQRNC